MSASADSRHVVAVSVRRPSLVRSERDTTAPELIPLTKIGTGDAPLAGVPNGISASFSYNWNNGTVGQLGILLMRRWQIIANVVVMLSKRFRSRV